MLGGTNNKNTIVPAQPQASARTCSNVCFNACCLPIMVNDGVVLVDVYEVIGVGVVKAQGHKC